MKFELNDQIRKVEQTAQQRKNVFLFARPLLKYLQRVPVIKPTQPVSPATTMVTTVRNNSTLSMDGNDQRQVTPTYFYLRSDSKPGSATEASQPASTQFSLAGESYWNNDTTLVA